MAVLSPEEKSNVIAEYQRDPDDTGSPEVQIAVLTHEIRELTEHLKIHKHDFHAQRGLMKKVGRRKSLMKYLLREDPDTYRQLIDRLQIRG